MIAINTAGRLLYCNRNGQALLKSARVLHLRNGVLSCADAARRKEFAAAIALTIDTGQPAHLLLSDSMQADQRHSVSLSQFLKPDTRSIAGEHEGVLCLVAPLDHRRTATVHQLMQLFGYRPQKRGWRGRWHRVRRWKPTHGKTRSKCPL